MKSNMRPETNAPSTGHRETERIKTLEKANRDELSPEMESYLRRMDEKLESKTERARLLNKR
jgi:hypothetical protein